MMKRYLLMTCAAAIATTASAASHGVSPSTLSADQIVAQNIAARGGLKAWRAVDTLVLTGQMDAGGTKHARLPFVMEMKRPHMSRLEIKFQGQAALQVYDGSQGWKLRPFLGRNEVEPFSPDEARLAADWAELDGPLVDYARKGTRIKLEGKEAVDGHDAYKLKLTFKDGVERHLWIDAKSFLDLKIDGDPHRLDGKMRHVAIYYHDYKTEDGLTMPRTLKTVIDGGTSPRTMTIEQVTINRPLDDAQFSKHALTMAAASDR